MVNRLCVLFVLPIVAACARPAVVRGLPAPNPNGCYVMVFEQPDFRGSGDVLNGPGRWRTLENLRQTNEQGWNERIRSLRLGSTATLVAFTDVDFKGETLRLPAQSERPRLDPAFSGRIESLEIACP